MQVYFFAGTLVVILFTISKNVIYHSNWDLSIKISLVGCNATQFVLHGYHHFWGNLLPPSADQKKPTWSPLKLYYLSTNLVSYPRNLNVCHTFPHSCDQMELISSHFSAGSSMLHLETLIKHSKQGHDTYAEITLGTITYTN